MPLPLSREFITSTAILDRREVDLPDAWEAPAELTAGARNFLASGNRAMTVMPMMRGESAIGTVNVIRRRPGPLSDKQRELLRIFANQAVIAIENTRLFNELRQRTTDLGEALEQQTATSDVLKINSSSPGELAPVFQAMLENAVRICEAKFGFMNRYEGDTWKIIAVHGAARPIPTFCSSTDIGGQDLKPYLRASPRPSRWHTSPTSSHHEVISNAIRSSSQPSNSAVLGLYLACRCSRKAN
jgi:hypothetical protein